MVSFSESVASADCACVEVVVTVSFLGEVRDQCQARVQTLLSSLCERGLHLKLSLIYHNPYR
jgi:hypothetical protein